MFLTSLAASAAGAAAAGAAGAGGAGGSGVGASCAAAVPVAAVAAVGAAAAGGGAAASGSAGAGAAGGAGDAVAGAAAAGAAAAAVASVCAAGVAIRPAMAADWMRRALSKSPATAVSHARASFISTRFFHLEIFTLPEVIVQGLPRLCLSASYLQVPVQVTVLKPYRHLRVRERSLGPSLTHIEPLVACVLRLECLCLIRQWPITAVTGF